MLLDIRVKCVALIMLPPFKSAIEFQMLSSVIGEKFNSARAYIHI